MKLILLSALIAIGSVECGIFNKPRVHIEIGKEPLDAGTDKTVEICWTKEPRNDTENWVMHLQVPWGKNLRLHTKFQQVASLSWADAMAYRQPDNTDVFAPDFVRAKANIAQVELINNYNMNEQDLVGLSDEALLDTLHKAKSDPACWFATFTVPKSVKSRGGYRLEFIVKGKWSARRMAESDKFSINAHDDYETFKKRWFTGRGWSLWWNERFGNSD